MSNPEAREDDIELLLPWYATSQLSPKEAACVEAYLAANPKAHHQLAMIKEEREVAVDSNEALPMPSPGALDRLMARAETEMRPRKRIAVGASLFAQLGTWLEGLAPQTRGALVAAALALVVVQGAVLGTLLGTADDPVFRIASAPDAAGHTEAVILVRFMPDATADAIGALLGELDIRIVDGPKPGGIYGLAVAEGVDAENTVVRLREHRDIVSFAAAGSS